VLGIQHDGAVLQFLNVVRHADQYGVLVGTKGHVAVLQHVAQFLDLLADPVRALLLAQIALVAPAFRGRHLFQVRHALLSGRLQIVHAINELDVTAVASTITIVVVDVAAVVVGMRVAAAPVRNHRGTGGVPHNTGASLGLWLAAPWLLGGRRLLYRMLRTLCFVVGVVHRRRQSKRRFGCHGRLLLLLQLLLLRLLLLLELLLLQVVLHEVGNGERGQKGCHLLHRRGGGSLRPGDDGSTSRRKARVDRQSLQRLLPKELLLLLLLLNGSVRVRKGVSSRRGGGSGNRKHG
jgi:hypothetical protein